MSSKNPMPLELERKLYYDGIQLFNEHEFFEAHEVWEDIWHMAYGLKHDFYQGLIDRAASFPLTFDTVDQPTQRQAVAAGFPERTFPAHDATVVVTGHEPSERRATLIQSS